MVKRKNMLISMGTDAAISLQYDDMKINKTLITNKSFTKMNKKKKKTKM
jgi:hypothetical protein